MGHFALQKYYYETKIFVYFYYNVRYVKTATVHLVWITDVGPLYLPGQGRTTCPEVQPLVKHLLHTIDIRYSVVALQKKFWGPLPAYSERDC
jgi:hypothetical protein